MSLGTLVPPLRASLVALKYREPRLNVMISARMRAGASWNDACILNLSSRGMLVRAPAAPSRGSYLEIRRGHHVIVARVVWADADRFGVQTQDPIPTASLVRDLEGPGPATAAAPAVVDRRAVPRSSASRHEVSRWRSRAMEFGTIAIVAGAGAMLVLGAVVEFFARPLAAAGSALGSG